MATVIPQKVGEGAMARGGIGSVDGGDGSVRLGRSARQGTLRLRAAAIRTPRTSVPFPL